MIFLTGFMGSGKTTVGRKLAELLKSRFIDLDSHISKKACSSINEIFACAGQAAFRALERDALLEIALKEPGSVVATGGGLPADPANRVVMKACGYIVYLRATFEMLVSRISVDSGRPLWNEQARNLFQERQSAYEDADIIVDTEEKTQAEVAIEIFDLISKASEPVAVLVPGAPYPVHIGKGIYKDIRKYIIRYKRPEGVFALVDEQVIAHYGRLIRSSLTGIKNHLMPVPSGETSKSFPFLMKVLDTMFASKANRQWICLAIGGGVTGDLGAFASSIFMRGIPVVQVPTTLLAQVDSSIGGKTGIDVRQGKNLIGTFHQPMFVLSDVDFLKSIGDTQVRDAMAEVIKYGVIMDRDLFEYLEQAHELDYEKVVSMCTRDKAAIVSRDEREGGLRRILNFGHTLGHAIELLGDYKVSHGRAVAAGIYFACWLSKELGLIKTKDMERIYRLIKKWAYPLNGLECPQPDEITGAIASDKKGAQGGIHFVLTRAVGDATVKKLTSSQILGAYGRFVRESEEGLR